LRFARDRHPNPEAHRLFAGAIGAFLEARGLIDAAASPARTGDR
jgi:phospholipase/lecithinase/hemolysin